jgi:PAS domain-containing protein
MDDRRRQALRGYGLAVGSVAAAAAVRFALSPFLANRIPSSLFLIAILVTCLYGGYGASWLALALGAIPVSFLYYAQSGSFDPPTQMAMVAHLLLGTLIIMLGKSERVARHTAERNAADALNKQRRLEEEIAEREAIEQQLREQQDALQEQQQQLELALQAGHLGVWTWDMATNRVRTTENQAILHGRSADRTELSIEEAMGNVHPDDRHVVRDAMQRALRAEVPEGSITYRTVWSDHSIHWVESVGRVFFDDSGKPTRVLGVTSDVTDK